MNKANNENKKVDSLPQTLLAIARLGLMVFGIIGIGYHVFREDGLMEQWLKSLFSSTQTLLISVIIAFVVSLLWRWLNASPDGKASKRGDIPLYAMMAVGAFFLYRWVTTGSF